MFVHLPRTPGPYIMAAVVLLVLGVALAAAILLLLVLGMA